MILVGGWIGLLVTLTNPAVVYLWFDTQRIAEVLYYTIVVCY